VPDRRGSPGKHADPKRPYRIDPDVAHARAVSGAKARTGVDYHIRKLVESANTISAEQAETLRALLPPPGA
jgi:hypothetical protein